MEQIIFWLVQKIKICFMKFTEFGLDETLLEAIGYMNFEEATEIQNQAIPMILDNHDIIGCAQTGTGKTAAFVLPVLDKLIKNRAEGTKALILVPTRELAMQIDQQIQGLAYFTNTSCYPVYGGGDGVSWENERKALSGGASIIIATPGRLIAHINNGYVNFSKLEYLILDEADRMLDIGFYDDIIKIIKEVPKERQSLLFSATMAPKIRKLAHEILSKPKEINLAVSKPAAGVTQEIYLAHEEQKNALTRRIIDEHKDFKSIIIFSSTKKKVEQLTRQLKSKGHNVEGISSDYDQKAREEVLLKFKSRQTRIVVATDVLSRGIDIKDIDLVINYDVPSDAEDYVHRVGRTARAASKGLAITLVCPDDMVKFSRIERFIEIEFEKLQPPEDLGPGPEYKLPERKGRRKKGGGKPHHKRDGHKSKGGNNRHKGSHKKHSRAKDHGSPKGQSKPRNENNKSS